MNADREVETASTAGDVQRRGEERVLLSSAVPSSTSHSKSHRTLPPPCQSSPVSFGRWHCFVNGFGVFFLEFSMMSVPAPQSLPLTEAGFLPLSRWCGSTAHVPSSGFWNYCLLFEAASDIHPAVPSREVSGSQWRKKRHRQNITICARSARKPAAASSLGLRRQLPQP